MRQEPRLFIEELESAHLGAAEGGGFPKYVTLSLKEDVNPFPVVTTMSRCEETHSPCFLK